ncbi:hypothetical protein FCM35_KLT15847 [Carex littledalei]|uniref:3'-5' exonuclease domain-containing protein n=1 Tax=Carex littledalei TaxID=544730 RepID=A0A833VJ65_9POAL|nr:hypothetical protein FCM35_KLT15847 [Carex littledalei]
MEMDRNEMRQCGLQNLVREIMGVHMEKPRWVRTSDWASSMLSIEQIEYAAVDAFASFEVARRLDVGDF